MSATAASKEFGRFIDAAQREPVLLTKKAHPVAIKVLVADWGDLVAIQIERAIAAGLADIETGRETERSEITASCGRAPLSVIAYYVNSKREAAKGSSLVPPLPQEEPRKAFHDRGYSENLADSFKRDIDRFIQGSIGDNPNFGHVWHASRAQDC